VPMSRQITIFMSYFSVGVMAVILSLGMLPLLWTLFVFRRSKERGSTSTMWLLSCAWVVSEWLRSVAFSLFLYGNGASIGDFWNFGSLGLALIDTPLGYASRVAGMYGLSLLCVSIALALYILLT